MQIKKKGGGVGAQLYAIDPTPKSLAYLNTQNLPDNFHVLSYALSDRDEMLEFALPTTEGWVSGSIEDVKNDTRNFDFKNKIKVEGRTLKSIMEKLGHTEIDLLKIDIEGSEFSVINRALLDKLDIRQMCMDHHEHMFKKGNNKLKEPVSGIHRNNYVIFYAETDVSKNRAFSCIRKDEIAK